MRCCVALRSVCSEAHTVHALMTRCSFTVVSHRIRLDISSSLPIQFHVVIHEPHRHTASTRSKGGHSMFGRSVCQRRAEQMTHMTCFSCVFIRRVSQWTTPQSSSRNFVHFLCQPAELTPKMCVCSVARGPVVGVQRGEANELKNTCVSPGL